MTTEQSKLLAVFEARVRQLVFLCDEFKEKNMKLENSLKDLDESYRALLEENRILKNKYDNLKMAKIISVKQDDFKAAKDRLSKLVREVDKCIALLNE
jgi:FtsZ-binding cell division protein ZapB